MDECRRPKDADAMTLAVLSWNACRLPVRHARAALELLIQPMKAGKQILCLQEVNTWFKSCGHVYNIGKRRLSLYADSESDCAIVVSQKLSKQQKRGVFSDLLLCGCFGEDHCSQFALLSIRKL